MFQLLYKFLILNKKVSVPGIGVFYIDRKPAYLDFSNKVFIAPSGQIAFTEGSATTVEKFYSFLSKEQQIEASEAVQHFNDFAQSLTYNLHTNGRVELPGFGWLSKDGTGVLKFQPAKELSSFYTNVAAERTIRDVSNVSIPVAGKIKNKSIPAVVNHETTSYKKDYWWVFAILLAGAAIAAIIYYYNQNGSFR